MGCVSPVENESLRSMRRECEHRRSQRHPHHSLKPWPVAVASGNCESVRSASPMRQHALSRLVGGFSQAMRSTARKNRHLNRSPRGWSFTLIRVPPSGGYRSDRSAFSPRRSIQRRRQRVDLRFQCHSCASLRLFASVGERIDKSSRRRHAQHSQRHAPRTFVCDLVAALCSSAARQAGHVDLEIGACAIQRRSDPTTSDRDCTVGSNFCPSTSKGCAPTDIAAIEPTNHAIKFAYSQFVIDVSRTLLSLFYAAA